MTEPAATASSTPPGAGRKEPAPKGGFVYVLAVAIAVLFVVFLRFPATVNNRFPSAGEPAPVFDARLLSGGPFSLAGEKGKRVVILNFWASWCDPCIKEMPDLESLYRQTRDRGVVLVAVNQDSREAIARDFTKRLGITMPVIWDEDGRIAKKFGTFRFPETYIVDLDGRIAKKIFGPVEWASAERVNYVIELASKGGKVDAVPADPDLLQGGSREQLSDREHDLRNSPN